MANCRYCGTDCPEQGEHDRFFDCELYTDRIPTNADRIRGMDDEELARFLWEQNGGNRYWKSVEKYLDWLEQPVKEELI